MQGETKIPKKSIQQVLHEHSPELMKIPGVVGTAQSLCDGEPCIMVMVAACTAALEQKIPKRLEGYRVWIRVTGEFRALGAEDEA